MTKLSVNEFRNEIISNMTDNILPYWMNKMVDEENGGFYGRRDANDNLVADAPKGAILNGRLLWSFAAAYRMTKRPEYLEMANRAKRYIIDHFYDKQYGGVYWSVNADGSPLDTKKQIYAIGFVIYGLSELVRATGDAEALVYAIRLFHDIEEHSRDRRNGGYLEALTREWGEIADMRLSDKDANEKKTMNTHLHVIEPYTNLYRVWKDVGLRDAIEELMDIFFNTIEDSRSHHLGLFYDEEWNRHDGCESFGHDIEASWLLLETALVLDDQTAIANALKHTRDIAYAALEGLCDDGSMVYERHADGSICAEKHWWVQAECVIGLVYLYRFHGVAEALDMAIGTWNYIKNNIVDYTGGEWHWSRLADGSQNNADDKAGFWKCPYHNSRMCMEVYSCLADMDIKPVRFEPYLKPVIWGGSKISAFKHIDCDRSDIGESWEISGVTGHESVVASGPDKGMTLPQIIGKYKGDLVGWNVYSRFGTEFPLLIKIIDAKSNLSLQVHPDDALAMKRHNSRGKSEMWYIIDAEADATILAGLSQQITPDEYAKRVADNTILDVVACHDSHPGDLFVLPAGRIHAIGAGNMLAEIQETSDITYRVYDYDRRDANGNPRELHVELAKDAIDYNVYSEYKGRYNSVDNGEAQLVKCRHFSTRLVAVDGVVDVDTSKCDSFRVVMCLEGAVRMTDSFGNEETLASGDTLLVPASVSHLTFSGKGKCITATM